MAWIKTPELPRPRQAREKVNPLGASFLETGTGAKTIGQSTAQAITSHALARVLCCRTTHAAIVGRKVTGAMNVPHSILRRASLPLTFERLKRLLWLRLKPRP